MTARKGADHHRARYPELHDPEWLRARYVDDGLSCDAIAELVDFDCHRESVRAALLRHEIPVRDLSTAQTLRWRVS